MELSELKNKGLKIELGGREMLLRYDLNALAYLEIKLGKNFWDIDMGANGMALKTLKHFLRAGLLHNYDNDKYYDIDDYNSLKPTLGEIGKMVDMGDLLTLPQQIQEALALAMPEAEEAGEGENRPGEPSTGSESATSGQ